MGFPNHSFLWAQWTSETMNLGTRKEGDGGMDGGRERNTTIKIKQIRQIKWDKKNKCQRLFLSLCLSHFAALLH